MAWNPDLPLIYNSVETTPINVNIAWSPTIDPPEPSATSYQAWWTSILRPDNVVLTVLPALGGVNVAGPNCVGLAPIQVDYLLDGVPGQVTSWSALPADAQQIFRYSISGINVNTATFNVRAYFFDGSYSDAGYQITATVNYDTGRDILVAEVNARR